MAPVKRNAIRPRKTCVRMVMEAIMALRDRQGSSPKDIRRYIESKYRKDFQGNRDAIAQKVNMALRLGANTGVLAQKHGNPDRWVLGDRAANRQNPKSRSASNKRSGPSSLAKSMGGFRRRRRRRGRKGKKGKKGRRRRRRRRGRKGKKGKKGRRRRRRGRRGRKGKKKR